MRQKPHKTSQTIAHIQLFVIRWLSLSIINSRYATDQFILCEMIGLVHRLIRIFFKRKSYQNCTKSSVLITNSAIKVNFVSFVNLKRWNSHATTIFIIVDVICVTVWLCDCVWSLRKYVRRFCVEQNCAVLLGNKQIIFMWLQHRLRIGTFGVTHKNGHGTQATVIGVLSVGYWLFLCALCNCSFFSKFPYLRGDK